MCETKILRCNVQLRPRQHLRLPRRSQLRPRRTLILRLRIQVPGVPMVETGSNCANHLALRNQHGKSTGAEQPASYPPPAAAPGALIVPVFSHKAMDFLDFSNFFSMFPLVFLVQVRRHSNEFLTGAEAPPAYPHMPPPGVEFSPSNCRLRLVFLSTPILGCVFLLS